MMKLLLLGVLFYSVNTTRAEEQKTYTLYKYDLKSCPSENFQIKDYEQGYGLDIELVKKPTRTCGAFREYVFKRKPVKNMRDRFRYTPKPTYQDVDLRPNHDDEIFSRVGRNSGAAACTLEVIYSGDHQKLTEYRAAVFADVATPGATQAIIPSVQIQALGTKEEFDKWCANQK